MYCKIKSLIHVTLKKEKKIHAGFAVTPQTAKVRAIVCDKYLVKMEKALNIV